MNTQRLISELRRRYRTPGDALRRLGLDRSTLRRIGIDVSAPSENGKHDFRVAFEQMLPELYLPQSATEKIYALLDEHIPLRDTSIADRARADDRRQRHADDDLTDADRRELAYRTERPPALEANDDEDDALEAEVRSFLAKKGMPTDAIDEAIELRRRAIERGAAGDGLPRNGMSRGIGGRVNPQQAADSFHEMFPYARRIGGWAEPTVGEVASFNRDYPSAKKIGSGTRSTSMTERDASSFERMYPEAMRIKEGAY